MYVIEYQTSVMWSTDYPELTVLLDKHSRGLPSKNVNFIKDFCEFDYISSIMPGKRDFLLIRQGDQQVYVQK